MNGSEKLKGSTKKKILVVDDADINRMLLCDMLQDDFDIIEASNGMEAVTILHDSEMEISLMLLDIVMPVMDGFEVLAMMNKKGWINTIPVIMISAENGGTYIDRAYDLGAIDYINRPFDERTVKHRVMSNFLLTVKHKEMSEMLSAQIYQKEKDNSLLIEILSHIVEFRNGESGLHVLHVHAITEMLLNAVVKKTDKYNLTSRDISIISTASALHDIGKIAIPDEIINKPGRFTPEEFAIMKTHTTEGAKMLKNMPAHKDEPLVKASYDICRWHHERYDGKGYPDGLKGDEIPIGAQAVALADVYDALTSKRVYKPAIPADDAVKMIMNGECGAFNPLLLECLSDIAERLKKELTLISFGRTTEKSIDNSVKQILKTGPDVSNRTLKAIEHERMRYKYLADITKEITFEYVVAPEMIKLSEWAAEHLGLPVNILNPSENEQWLKIIKKEDFADFLNKMQHTTPESSVAIEKYTMDIGGKKGWNKIIAKVIWSDDESGEFEGAIGKIVDVNDETLAIKYLEHKAEHDLKTGILNYNAAKNRIDAILDENPEKHFALAVFDLDNFKEANDQYGHQFGDDVLKEVADRLTYNIRNTDIAARIGGDEFILFMEYKTSVEPQVNRIFQHINGDFKGFEIKTSVGIARTEDGCTDYEDMFFKADAAMYTVKRGNKNAYAYYDDSMKDLLNNKREEQEQ